ncbi:MAG TPA: hypothetical protein VIF35_02100 [Streptosporangiaceae bacterium]|jgi:hypothetical protein
MTSPAEAVRPAGVRPAGAAGPAEAARPAAPHGGRLLDGPAVIDGVDVDAVAAAVRACPSVDDLVAGPWGGVVSYFPGRQVAGIRVRPDHVLISVRGRWGVPVAELASQVRRAVSALAGPRRVDIEVADLAGGPAGA